MSSSGRKRREDLWVHFIFDDKENKTKCKACDAVFRGKNTTNLKRHLQNSHLDIFSKIKQKLAAACPASTIAGKVDNPDQPLQLPSTTTRPAQPTPTPSCPPTLRTQNQTSEAEVALLAGLEEHSHQMMALQQQILHRLRPSTGRERDTFTDWVRSVLHELDYGLWRRCQQEISNIVYRYIGENDQLKREQAPAAPTPLTSFQPLQEPTLFSISNISGGIPKKVEDE